MIIKYLRKGPVPALRKVGHPELPPELHAKGCTFDLSPACGQYDWLVVVNDLPKPEKLSCPVKNTIFICGEPLSIGGVHPSRFLRQFAIVVSSRESVFVRHPCLIQSTMTWGWHHYSPKNHRIDYDTMCNKPPPIKSKSISVVCSQNQLTKYHRRRLSFIEQLTKLLPEIDRFGRGYAPVDAKRDVILPYRYHIAIENYQCGNYWTEKLADAWLGYSLPFYYGASNISRWFPPESYIPIDIADLKRSAKTISDAINADEYSKRLPYIQEARHLLMSKYNRFLQIRKTIQKAENGEIKPAQTIINNGSLMPSSFFKHGWHNRISLASRIAKLYIRFK